MKKEVASFLRMLSTLLHLCQWHIGYFNMHRRKKNCQLDA